MSRIKKHKKRLAVVSLNTGARLVFPIITVATSWAVFHFSNASVWGKFLSTVLFMSIAPMILGWGNKEYLLRSFSISPATAKTNWQSSFSSRIYLFPLLALSLLFFPWTFYQKIILFIFCIARVIYQSYDVIITFKKNFYVTLFLETFSFAGILLFIISKRTQLNVDDLLIAYCIAEIFKAIILSVIFRKEFPIPFRFRLDVNYFAAAFSFFILGFSSFLQSRIDLLCVNYFMPSEDVAHFQVLVNFLLNIQAISVFIIQPFIKNIYRLDDKKVWGIARSLFQIGLVLVPSGLTVAYFFIIAFYKFHPDILTVILGGISIVPIFYYLPFIYLLYKRNLQNQVIYINTAGIILGSILNILFVSLLKGGQNGALLATAIIQWLLVGAYVYLQKSKRFIPQTPNAI